MSKLVRRLNDRGREAFRDWLENGAAGAPPYPLLEDATASVPLRLPIPGPQATFERRYDLGVELVNLLAGLDVAELQADAGLWDWLSLCLLDQLCPTDEAGRRKLLKIGHYLLELENHQRRNRHLVRSAWSLVRVHGTAALFMLAGPPRSHGDAAEQLSAYQDVITCKPLIAAIGRLVWDAEKASFKRGFAGRGPGSARRVPVVAKQFRLTYDLDSMRPEQILDLLPREFDRFREKLSSSKVRRPSFNIRRSLGEQRPEADQT